MQVATDEEMREFLNRHADMRCEGRQLRFDYPEARTIYVDLRVEEPSQLVYLARLAAHLRYEEGHFSPGAVFSDRFSPFGTTSLWSRCPA
jgi:hypothetical protein